MMEQFVVLFRGEQSVCVGWGGVVSVHASIDPIPIFLIFGSVLPPLLLNNLL